MEQFDDVPQEALTPAYREFAAIIEQNRKTYYEPLLRQRSRHRSPGSGREQVAPEGSFGHFLATLRCESELSRAELAEQLDTSPSVVSRWERGKATPFPGTLVRIASVFEQDVDEVLAIAGKGLDEKFADKGDDDLPVGQLLRRYRLRSGESQESLAKKLEVADRMLAAWESGTGQPTLRQMLSLREMIEFPLDIAVPKSGVTAGDIPYLLDQRVEDGDGGFAAVIRRLRLAEGLSSEQLGRRLQVTGTAVRSWEAGDHTPDQVATVRRVAEMIGVHEDMLLELVGLPTGELLAEPSMSLGAEIRHWRRFRDLSRSDLAGAVGVSLMAVKLWEVDEDTPTLTNLARVAHALEIDLGRVAPLAGYDLNSDELAALQNQAEAGASSQREESDRRLRLGSTIREMRAQRGWSMQILADKVGVRRQSVSYVETAPAATRMETVDRYAAAFDLTGEQLLAEAGYSQSEIAEIVAA